MKHLLGWAWTLLPVMLLGAATLLFYQGILFADPGQQPWGSDTMGHLLKVEYLLESGTLYPDLLPAWYLGMQLFRYHPPLPYYCLAALTLLTGATVPAANLFIALCAWLGGAGWLLFRRWLGLGLALAGGLLFLILPDNVRVALAEGNLPRVLATALLPYALFALLRALEPGGNRWHRLSLALLFLLLLLSHAMMAAIYALCLGLLALLLALGQPSARGRLVRALLAIGLGLGLGGWWLLPSLSGGITALDASALGEALAVFPLDHYLQPTLRLRAPETIYIGAALLLLGGLPLLLPWGRSAASVALALTGLFGLLITMPGFNTLFRAFPLSHLFWPLRFLGVASALLLLALLWQLRDWQARPRLLPALLFLLLLADQALSLPMIHLRPPRAELRVSRALLEEGGGWRAATLDQSRLGSAPSYVFSAHGGREQLFGWAYQGAHTARTVAALNEALAGGNSTYLLDRLDLLGVDDVLLLRSLPHAPAVAAALQGAGYHPRMHSDALSLYQRAGGPRAILAEWEVLGIGQGARPWSYLFPQMIVGSSPYLDEYEWAHLQGYRTLVLSGFRWHDQARAEALVRQAAEAGIRIVVDLTGVTPDPIAGIPRFLDVWAEPLILAGDPVRLQGKGAPTTRLTFGSPTAYWHTHTPQGSAESHLTFDYLGQPTTLLGSTPYGAGRIWFVGLNLPYHAQLTHDPAAVALLADLVGLVPGRSIGYRTIPLTDYKADQQGYRFSYQLAESATLLLPLAALEGMQVRVDGVLLPPANLQSYERLLLFDAPAGRHEVTLQRQPTLRYHVGWGVSGGAALLLLVLIAKEDRHE